ncbi:hypothetical protein [Mangrovihabitans endophyticus]|uniref:Uncharacterized protein n=1 Tax=Mangrovihabitans endophyticus TaxID=1751298 RepID=A0A8J3C962_9ACTN|nr:hypothetical protein [Mangrovihabitans endophyticus]GGL20803.1 hypothetical protein GCM10012284_64350 [Mangrovihabitans endophyticus]
MTVQVTVGENTGAPSSSDTRGTVTAVVMHNPDVPAQLPMVELTATVGDRVCSARLTINEAEILHGALDSIILDAAMLAGKATIARNSDA